MKIKVTAAEVVTAAAFIASSAHIVKVIDQTNPLLIALVYPLGIDGLIWVGIRAMQTGRKAVGAFALLIGAAYSLLFNAHAENALVMPAFLIAASMPVCLAAGMLIETTAKKAEPVREIETKIVYRDRELLPIAPPAPIRVKAETVKTVAIRRDASVQTDGRKDGRGRMASWDVEKAVALYLDGRTDAEVQTIVPVGAKPWQRTKRVIKMIETGGYSVDEMAGIAGVSALHVARIGKAMEVGKA